MRFVEWFLEKKLPEFQALEVAPNITDIQEIITEASTMDWSGPLSLPVIEAFVDAFSMLCDTAEEINWRVDSCPCQEISPITTTHVFFLFSVTLMGLLYLDFSFMDALWQYNSAPNPADAANGPQAYDHHLYYRQVGTPYYLRR